MTDIEFYKDKERRELFSIEHLGNIEAGNTVMIEGYLYNNTEYDIIDLDFTVPDSDVTILNMPKRLRYKTMVEIQLKYSPKETRMKALNTYITFSGKKVIPPE